MTAAELRARHPDASEMWIRLHASDPVRRAGPPPAAASRPSPARKRSQRTNAAPRRGRRVELVRNGATWSEARYWQQVRSCLRRGFRFWRPAVLALEAARVAAPGPRGRKWLFRCEACEKLHLRRNVEIDHRVPCGELRSVEHVAEFLARLTPEDPGAYAVLCRTCHRKKSDSEGAVIRARKKAASAGGITP
jgi:hypothetical protein